MADSEIEKTTGFSLDSVVDYMPNTVGSKTIYKKLTGSITALSFDTGVERLEKDSPFDTYLQVIEGLALITVNNMPQALQSGMAIIIPPHTTFTTRATTRLKMIVVVTKSGYE